MADDLLRLLAEQKRREAAASGDVPMLDTSLDEPTGDAPAARPSVLPRARAMQPTPVQGALPKSTGQITTSAQIAPAAQYADAAQGPEYPPAAQASARAAPESLDIAGMLERADQRRTAAYDKLTPSNEALAEYGKSGTMGTLAGLAMQMMGTEQQQGAGGTLFTKSLAELDRAKRDPWKVAESEARKLEAEAGAWDRRAALAQSSADRRYARDQADEARREAIQARRENAEMIGGMRAESLAARRDAQGEAESQRVFQREHTLRSDYGKVTKDITDGMRAAQQLTMLVPANVKAMTAQEQQALIFNFMKMLDPGSVVRESEYAAAAKARGLLDTIGNYGTYLQTGKPLTPTQVQNMVKVGNELQKTLGELRGQYNEQFTETAKAWKVDPRRIIVGGSSTGGASGAKPSGVNTDIEGRYGIR